MAEYIERGAAQVALMNFRKECSEQGVPYETTRGILYAAQELRSVPAADVAPVVRCKDCKYWHEREGWCEQHSHFVDSDGAFCEPWKGTEWKMFDADYFCKDGERRADNG